MKLTIRTKLLLAFGLIILFSSVVNIYGLIQMEVLSGLTTKLFNHPLQVTRAVLTADNGIIKIHRSMKDIALATNATDIEIINAEVQQYEQEVLAQFAIVNQWILEDEGKQIITETIKIFQDWSPIRKEVITLTREKAYAITKTKGAKHVTLLNGQMKKLVDYVAKKASGMYEAANATRDRVITTTIFALIIVIILTIILAVFISLSIVKSVQIIKTIAEQMVAGKIFSTIDDQTSFNQIIAYQDEMGDIGRAFFAVANTFETLIDDITLVSQGLMVGNLSVTPQAEYQGDFAQIKTSLTTALSNLQLVVEDIVQISEELVESKQQVIAKADYNGDFLPIKNSLETASIKLAESTTQNNIQNWLKTGQTQLNNKMSGEQDMFKLAKNIITFVTTYLEMPVGTFYLLEADDSTSLKLIASYAYTQRKGLRSEFLIGEGLVGQAALEKKELIITKVPKDYYIQISSGLGQALPNTIIVQPFLYENNLKGVIELASFKPITDIQREFLTQVMPNIGIAINSATSRSQMHKLLQQSQQQAEELQSQQEELRQTNESLEERSKDLEQQKLEIQDKNQVLEINRIEMEKVQIDMEKAQAAISIKAEELELASKYKSEFLANMSHELRTPLNSLLILSQLLTENNNGNLDTKQVEYAKTINSAGHDLLTLINDILDLSKVEAGKIEVQWENVSLRDLLTSIEQKFSPIANDKGVIFNLTIADNISPTLKTDGQRIKQIINNLLSNALKFTSEGEVKLIIQYPTEIPTSLAKLELNKTIAISVIDSGIGIPQDKQHSIFEAFQQADGSTSRSYGGTGLGLSISRQLARLLGGELVLVSELNQGSTFTLYLPNDESSAPENVQQKFTPLTLPEPPLLTEKYQSPEEIFVPDDRDDLSAIDRTILIIEDDRKFANILRDLAHSKGFKCLMAEDGLTGLNLAIEHKPNAIILDIGLPKLDGLTLMSKLKDNSSTRHIPVHFMSAVDESINAKKMGAVGYLVKPVTMEKLKETFKKIEIFLTKTVKTVLIVADNEPNQQRIMGLVDDETLKIEVSVTSEEACKKILETTYDCVILDMDLEQSSGSKLLERMQLEKSHPCKIPIIVYADRELTAEEEALLLRCSEEIPIKSVNSPERLVDEATLFLHQIESSLSNDKRKMLHMVHDKKTILKHKKVLIVDDDERNIFALATILENNDVEVICGVNGKEGLEYLAQHDDIAIVLMDIMMPEMDGYEAIREIRKQTKYRNLPIIALTAKAMKDDRAKCIEAGANDYLAKPIETDKLLSLMRVWLYR